MAFDIDWSLARAPNLLGGYLQGQQVRQERENALYQRQRQGQQDARQARLDTRQDQEWVREDEARATSRNALSAYGRGDTAGARKMALDGGDTKLVDVLNTMDENARKQVANQVSTMAEVAYGAQALPYAQRRQYIAQNAARLSASGIGEDRIAGFDPTDGNLRTAIMDGLSLKEKIDLWDKTTKPVEMDPTKTYAVREDPLGYGRATSGGPVAAPSAPMAGGSAAAANADDAISALTGMGARVTSGVRTPEHNAEVGGNPNSYHLASRGGSARDLVPPQGMSMGEFHGVVRQRLPAGWEAINEGDHIHIEPGRGAKVAGGGQSPPAGLTGDAGGDNLGGSLPGLRIIQQGRPEAKPRDPPSGYRWTAAGDLEPVPGGPGDPATKAAGSSANPRKAEADLRKEFNARPEVKAFREVDAAFRNVQATARNTSAAGDLSMIFGYMKMLDPESVVREGEFANAQNAAGIPDRVKNAYNKALNGERLNPQQRADFVRQAKSVYDNRKARFDEISNEYRGYATDYDVNPDRVASAPQAAQAAQGGGNGSAKGKAFTPEQLKTAAQFKGAKGKAGTAALPYAPTTEGEYNNLPRNSHYIHRDGSIRVKH